jgi:hypothetical protein
MKQFFVEVYNPPFPNKTYHFRVFQTWNKDALSPNLVALYRVDAAEKQDAVAKVLLGKAFTMVSPDGLQLKYAA